MLYQNTWPGKNFMIEQIKTIFLVLAMLEIDRD